MNLKEKRNAKGLFAREVADAIGMDAGLYSKIENYHVLPVPADFNGILEALGCAASEIYEPHEVALFPREKTNATGGARTHAEPVEYKLTVRLANGDRAILTKEVLEKCGYASISDWIKKCVLRLKAQHEIIIKAEKKKLRKAQ